MLVSGLPTPFAPSVQTIEAKISFISVLVGHRVYFLRPTLRADNFSHLRSHFFLTSSAIRVESQRISGTSLTHTEEHQCLDEKSKMSFKLDYNEPLPKVIERLKSEHADFHAKLERIKSETRAGNLPVAISLLNLFKPFILRHAVEEEARLMRAIMQGKKDKNNQSIEIMQQHRRIEEFLQDKLPYLSDLPSPKAAKEIEEFADEVLKHHAEEEHVVFPLALKSK